MFRADLLGYSLNLRKFLILFNVSRCLNSAFRLVPFNFYIRGLNPRGSGVKKNSVGHCFLDRAVKSGTDGVSRGSTSQ